MDDIRDKQIRVNARAASILRLIGFLPVLAVFSLRAADFDVEPKRPLALAQELRVVQDARSIKISGETFSYTFGKDNGLISSVEVLGRESTGGAPIPDLSAAEHLDPSRRLCPDPGPRGDKIAGRADPVFIEKRTVSGDI